MAASVKNSVKVKLNFERDTKGTHVFSTEDKEQAVTNIYVKKGKLGDPTPHSINVTVEGA